MLDTPLCMQAVANYILYRTTSHIRFAGNIPEDSRTEYVERFMDQTLHEATRDEPRLRRLCMQASGEQGTKRPATEL